MIGVLPKMAVVARMTLGRLRQRHPGRTRKDQAVPPDGLGCIRSPAPKTRTARSGLGAPLTEYEVTISC